MELNTNWLKGNRNLLAAYRNMGQPETLPWDHYEVSMADVDVAEGHDDTYMSKAFFIRKAPFGGTYALLGGLTKALRVINDWRCDPVQAEMLRYLGVPERYVQYLQHHQRLRLRIYAMREGTPFFPHEPAIIVYGPKPDVRLVEGIVSEACNYGSLSLTKWHRIVQAARPGQVLEFSRRRAQNSVLASIYAACAGCAATSNTAVLQHLDIPVKGTMGHEGPQSVGDPRAWFDAMLRANPRNAIGLVDTISCLDVDFPAWLDCVYVHREEVKEHAAVWGWRNDSGSLAVLTIEQYQRFRRHPLSQDRWFVERARVVQGGGLDEYKIQGITRDVYSMARQIGLDGDDLVSRFIWAVGDAGGSCTDQPILGGVMKIGLVGGQASIKLALAADASVSDKTSIPGFVLSANVYDAGNEHQGVLLYRPSTDALVANVVGSGTWWPEDVEMCAMSNRAKRTLVRGARVEPKHTVVYDSLVGTGPTAWQETTVDSVHTAIEEEVGKLWWGARQLQDPTPPRVSVTEDLFDLRQRMIENWQILESAA